MGSTDRFASNYNNIFFKCLSLLQVEISLTKKMEITLLLVTLISKFRISQDLNLRNLMILEEVKVKKISEISPRLECPRKIIL